MPRNEISLTLQGSDRKSVRDNLIKIFLNEVPGTGNGINTSVYIYFVETLSSGKRVYIKRPARLNKGMDFEVNVEGANFGKHRRTTMPSHNSLIDDLVIKKKENSSEYSKLETLIDRLYKCDNVVDSEILQIKFYQGYPVDLLLKAIKWLFIEQDVTYWNWSGRAMLYNGIKKV